MCFRSGSVETGKQRQRGRVRKGALDLELMHEPPREVRAEPNALSNGHEVNVFQNAYSSLLLFVRHEPVPQRALQVVPGRRRERLCEKERGKIDMWREREREIVMIVWQTWVSCDVCDWWMLATDTWTGGTHVTSWV